MDVILIGLMIIFNYCLLHLVFNLSVSFSAHMLLMGCFVKMLTFLNIKKNQIIVSYSPSVSQCVCV